MYDDPRSLRDHPTRVRLHEDADRLLKALAAYLRTQPAVLARDILLDGLERMACEELSKESTAA